MAKEPFIGAATIQTSVLDKDRAIPLDRSPYRKTRFVGYEAVSDDAAEKVDDEIDG